MPLISIVILGFTIGQRQPKQRWHLSTHWFDREANGPVSKGHVETLA
jgi:hypothetical protein